MRGSASFSIKVNLIPAIFILFFAVSCTKSGNLGGSSTNAGTLGTITGSVNGGLSAVANATLNLMIAGNSTPLASANSSSTGAFSIAFTNPGGNNLLYIIASGGNAGSGVNSNNQFLAVAGTGSAPITSLQINELTTAAFMTVMHNKGFAKDSGGSVTFNAPTTATDVVTQYNNFITSGGLNSSLSASNQQSLNTAGNALAYCIETPNNCAGLFTAPAAAGSTTAASNLLDFLYGILHVPAESSYVYGLAFIVSNNTGFLLPSSSIPSGFTMNVPLTPIAVNTFVTGAGAGGIAIDSSRNIWLGGSGTGTVIELNSSGTVIGTFTVGGIPVAIAIDAAGNVWVGNQGNSTVTELNPAGTVIGSFTAGNNDQGLAIDAQGNIWVPSFGSGNLTELNASGTNLGSISLSNAVGTAIDSQQNVWVTRFNGVVSKVTGTGSSMAVASTTTTGTNSYSDAIDPSGNVWVANRGTTTVTEVSSSGSAIGSFSTSIHPYSIAIDSNGNIWVGNFQSLSTVQTLVEFNPAGVILSNYNVSAGVPTAMAIDSLGNVWTSTFTGSLIELTGVASPGFFPYSGPVWPNSSI